MAFIQLSAYSFNSQAPEPLLKPRPDLGIVGVNDSLVGKTNNRDCAKLSPPPPPPPHYCMAGVDPFNYPMLRMHSEGSSDCSWAGLYILYVCKKSLKLKNTHFQKSISIRKASLRI